MEQEPLQPAEEWAVETFGAADLGDPRRTDRFIQVASALATTPSASLPQSSQTWGQTKGAYRWLSDPAFGYQDILMPHWSQVSHEATQSPRTLLPVSVAISTARVMVFLDGRLYGEDGCASWTS